MKSFRRRTKLEEMLLALFPRPKLVEWRGLCPADIRNINSNH